MRKKGRIYQLAIALLLCFLQMAGIAMYGQDRPRAASKRAQRHQTDTLNTVVNRDSLTVADSLAAENKRKMLEMTASPDLKEQPVPTDSLQKAIDPKRWVPNPTKATWLALVIPGGGQIYNRKYWKLPIFYGGFAGCAYALTWNSKMYKDYTQAYQDIMSDNPNNDSYMDFLPAGYTQEDVQNRLDYYQELFRKRKDVFRRQRDLSIIAFIGVYLLSVIDAYVDAELSNFDISNDLGMTLEPAIFNDAYRKLPQGIGLQCSIRF